MVDSIYKLLKVLIMLVLIVKYIRSGAKIRKKDVLLFTVLLIWLFSAYCNLHSFGDNLQQVLSIIGIFLLVKIINTKDKQNQPPPSKKIPTKQMRRYRI